MAGLNLQGGFGAGAAVDELHRILAERFREEVERNNVTQEQNRLAEAAMRREEDARQANQRHSVDLGRLGVDQGQLAETISQNRILTPGQVALTTARTDQLNREPAEAEKAFTREQGGRVQLFGLKNAADVAAQEAGFKHDTAMGEQQNRFKIGQIRTSGAEDRLTKAAPSDKTQETDEVKNLAAAAMDNPDMLDKFTPSMRERVVSHIQGSGTELKSKGKQRAEESKQQALGLITEIENAAKDPINSGFAGAVGTKGPTSLFGALEKPISGSKARTVADKIDQLTATLTIPRLEVMHGLGAMSDADFKNLKQSVTALNRGMGETEFNNELAKIRHSLEGSGPNLNVAPGSVNFSLDFDPVTGKVGPPKKR